MCARVIFKFYMHELTELLNFCRSYYIKASSFQIKGEQTESIISAIIETILFISQMWNNYFLIILYVKHCVSWCWKYQRSGSLASRTFKSAHGTAEMRHTQGKHSFPIAGTREAPVSSTGSGWQIAYTWNGTLWGLMDSSYVMEGKIGTGSGKMIRICLSGSVRGAMFGRPKVGRSDCQWWGGYLCPGISLITISNFRQTAFYCEMSLKHFGVWWLAWLIPLFPIK